MGGCSILGCKNRSERKEDGISFHSFPTDPEIRAKWINATGWQNWIPSKHARICSKHFQANSFVSKETSTLLKPNAIPSNLQGMNIHDCYAQTELVTKNLDSMPSSSKSCKEVKRSSQKSNEDSSLAKTQKLIKERTELATKNLESLPSTSTSYKGVKRSRQSNDENDSPQAKTQKLVSRYCSVLKKISAV